MAANQHPASGEVTRLRSPGTGRGRARRMPKGRQVEPQSLDEVRELLGDRPRQRDLLIDFLVQSPSASEKF